MTRTNPIWPLPPQPWPEYGSDGWLLNEDRALRDLMKGMVVTDQENRQRHVEAWFGHPDKELRAQDYPYVTIDLLQIQEGKDRVQRGDLYITDPPKWWGLKPLEAWQVGYLLEMPTPVDLDYQISTWARNPRHDRQILQQMITGGRTMLRNGLLYDGDHKIHRLDVLGHMKRDRTEEGGKRLFNNVFRVRVSSEVPWGIIHDHEYGYGTVMSIHMRIRSFLEKHQLTMDETTLVLGTVMGVDNDGPVRTASVDLGDNQIEIGIPVLSIVPALLVGDLVGVSKDLLEQMDGPSAGYRYVVMGIEHRPEQ
jgi:hypothetical protein